MTGSPAVYTGEPAVYRGEPVVFTCEPVVYTDALVVYMYICGPGESVVNTGEPWTNHLYLRVDQ